MAKISITQKIATDGVELKVSGSFTIENSADMREALMEAFSKGDLVTIDLTDVEAIDVSGLQMLCAAHRTSLGHDKRLVVVGSLQPNVKKSAEIAGYYRHVGCSQDVTKTCVWIGGN